MYILLIWSLVLVVEVRRSCRCSAQCWIEWEREKTIKPIIYPLNFTHILGNKKRWWISMPLTSNTEDRTYITYRKLIEVRNMHAPQIKRCTDLSLEQTTSLSENITLPQKIKIKKKICEQKLKSYSIIVQFSLPLHILTATYEPNIWRMKKYSYYQFSKLLDGSWCEDGSYSIIWCLGDGVHDMRLVTAITVWAERMITGFYHLLHHHGVPNACKSPKEQNNH